MYPKVQNAREMLTFLASYPERFACDSLLWPGAIAFFKVVTAVGAQAACILNMFYLNNALGTIKALAVLSILASFDDKMLAMISKIDTEGDMSSQPLEYEISIMGSRVDWSDKSYCYLKLLGSILLQITGQN